MATPPEDVEIIDLTGDSDEEMQATGAHKPNTPNDHGPRDAAPPTTQAATTAPGAPLPAKLAWLRNAPRPTMRGTFPADVEAAAPAQQPTEDFIALPSSDTMGWTPINPPVPQLRRSRRILARARRTAVRVVMPRHRQRSPSVEYLGSRLKGAAKGPLDVAEPALGQASLTRSRSSSVESVSENLRAGPLLQQDEGTAPMASDAEFRGDVASLRRDEGMMAVRPTKRARRDALRFEAGLAHAYDPYAAHQNTAVKASLRLPGAETTPEGSTELTIYTDGSCVRRFGGAGFAYQRGSTWIGRASALGVIYGSCDAELAAIFGAVKLARRVREADEHQVTIATDSQACLSRLNPDHIRADASELEEMVRAILQERRELAQEGIHLGFRWVKAHASIEGNVLADRLAGLGSEKSARGHKTYFNIPDVYAQFPELDKKTMIQNVALGMQEAGRRYQARTKQRRKDKVHRRRAAASAAARGSSDQLIASRIAEIASQTLAQAQQGV